MTSFRVLVVQMCRLGDILMTVPLLRGLKQAHPRAHVSLMVMDVFASAPVPARLCDRLIPFPVGHLASTLARDGGNWTRAFEDLRAFVDDVTAEPYDLAINLTHTDLSGLVMSLVPARRRRGLVTTPERARTIDGGPMMYLRAAVRSRELACFQLADLFAWTGGVGRDAEGLEIDETPADAAWADQWIAERGLTGRPLIAMQLGASVPSKQWPVERFAMMADLLDAELGEIVLVGGPGEQPLARRFMAAVSRPSHDAIGSTTIPRLAALLGRCRLLITNDTGPMHVAAAVGTPVMDITSGPVSVAETGPYGAGHLVIEPDMPCHPCPIDAACHHLSCRTVLSPAEAAAAARYAMRAGPPPALTGARLLESCRAASGRIIFVPVAPGRLTERDLIRLAAADMWEETLDVPPIVGSAAESGVDERDHVVDDARLAALADHCREVAAEADAAAAIIRTLPHVSAATRQVRAAAAHKKLERLLALGETERVAHAVVTYLRYEIGSARATDLAGMVREQLAAYAGAAARARLLARNLSRFAPTRVRSDRPSLAADGASPA